MKKDTCGISIIVPVYNGELFLEQCILSVLNQPKKNLELIIIDDGSEDESYKIYNKYLKIDNRVIVYKQENKGVNIARNKGIMLAKYNYIAFLDCDDVWENNIFDQSLNNLLNEGFDIIGFSYSMANNNLTRIKKIKTTNKQLINCPSIENILSGSSRSHSSFLYKASLIKENNIFVNGKRNEDNVFRDSCLYKAKKVIYIDKQIFLYRNNPNSTTHKSIDVDILYREVVSNWERMIEWVSQFEDKESKVICYYKDLIAVLIFEMIQEKSKIKLYVFDDDNIIEPNFLNYLKRKSAFEWNKKLFKKYKLFINNKKMFYLKYFFIGKFVNILRKLSNLKITQFIKERIKYDEKNVLM